MKNRFHGFFAILLMVAFAVYAEAQTTWTWVGDGTSNIVTNTAIWSGTGTVDLNNTSTTLIFDGTGNYTPTPYIGNTTIQIGTLTINKSGSSSLYAGHGDGSTTGSSPNTVITGVNIATAISYNPGASNSFVNTTGPIMLGSGATISGAADSTSILKLGTQVGDFGTPVTNGGIGIVSSNGPINKSGSFQLQLDGNATGLGNIAINSGGGSVFLTPNASGFESNVSTSSGTTFGIHPGTGATYAYSGVISGSGGFTMNGNTSSSVAILTGSNTYTSQTSVFNGTLQLGNSTKDSVLPNSAFVAINSGANLDVAGNQTINNISGGGAGGTITLESGKTLTIAPVTTNFTQTTYSGNITGPGALAVSGNGSYFTSGSKVKISGSNDYQGGTIVNGGTLEVTSGTTLGSGAATVNSGGTLVGDSSSMTGALTINSGGAIVIVNHFTAGSVTINGGGTYFWGLANATGTSGTDYGLLNISSAALTLNAAPGNQITLKLGTFSSGGSNPTMGAASNFDPTQSYTWDLTTGATSMPGGFAANWFAVDTSLFANSITGTFSVSNSSNNLFLNYVGAPIPEPAAIAAYAGLFALAVAVWRRKVASRLAALDC